MSGVRRIQRPRDHAGPPQRAAARLTLAVLIGAGPGGLGSAAVVAAAQASTLGPLGPVNAAAPGRADAAPTPKVTTTRLNGADRYETSALASARAFPDGASTVYLASGTSPTDALVAGTLPDGPVLLTTPTGVTAPVAREIRRLAPRNFVALGGTKAIPDAVIKTTVIKTTVIKTVVIKTVVIKTSSGSAGALAGHAAGSTPGPSSISVERLAGADRYATAIAVARRAFPRKAAEAYLASGVAPADALAGGSLVRGPILLSAPGGVRADLAAEVRRLSPARVVALGGTASVSEAVVTSAAAGREATRLGGTNRYETAAAIATYARPGGAPAAYLADGRSLVDALAAGTLRDGPVLLVDPSAATDAAHPAWRAISRLKLGTVVALGGPGAVPDAVLARAAQVASAALTPPAPAPALVPTSPSAPSADPTPVPTPVLNLVLDAGTGVSVDGTDPGTGYAGIADPGEAVTFTFTLTNSSNVALLDVTAVPSPGTTPVSVTPQHTGRVEAGATVTFRATYRMPLAPDAGPEPGAAEIRASLQVTAVPERCPSGAPSCPVVRTMTSPPVPTRPLRIVGKPEVVDEPGGTPGLLDPHPGQPDPGEDVRWVWEVTNLTGQELRDVGVSFVNVKGGGVLTAEPHPATIPARATVVFTRTYDHPARDYLTSPLEMYGRVFHVAAGGEATDLAVRARAGVPVAVAPPPGDR